VSIDATTITIEGLHRIENQLDTAYIELCALVAQAENDIVSPEEAASEIRKILEPFQIERTCDDEPEMTPERAAMLPLVAEVGKTYRTRHGITVEITHICDLSIHGMTEYGLFYYHHDGTPRVFGNGDWDLVEIIS